MKKNNKLKLIIGGAVEAAIVIFCIVVSIIVAVTYPKGASNNAEFLTLIEQNRAKYGDMIVWFQLDRTRILLVLILPMLVLLAIDIVYLVIFATRRESNLTEQEQAAIEAKAKEEVRAELMKEILAEEEAKKAAEAKTEEPPASEE